MKSFLTQVAEQLYGKYGDELSKLVVLFPSQRARLFFCEALLEVVDKPIWAPQFVTIDELMSQISSLHTADRLRLISELHAVYTEYHEEDFDRFYHWGEMLVADFDMVDKYMVDAERLFVNIADIKEIEADLSYLTPEQEEYCVVSGTRSAVICRSPSRKTIFLRFGAPCLRYTPSTRLD